MADAAGTERQAQPNATTAAAQAGDRSAPAQPAAQTQREAPSGGATTPASTRDYEREYNELKSRYDEVAPKAERYKVLDDLGMEPAALREVAVWGRDLAAKVQRGELTISQARAEAADRQQQQADPFERFEEMAPREQAAALSQVVAQNIRQMLDSELKGLRTNIDGFTQQQNLQTQLFSQAWKLANKYGLDFDDVVSAATQRAGMSPLQLMEDAAERLASPKKQQELIEQKAAEIAALKIQEKENERVNELFPQARVPRFLVPANQRKSPAQERADRLEAFRILTTKRHNAA